MKKIDIDYVVWGILTLPAIHVAWKIFNAPGPLTYERLSWRTAEWSAYLVVLCLAITPINMLLRGKFGSRLLVRFRRYIGVASFVYGVLHTIAYIVHVGGLKVAISQLDRTYVWSGLVVLILLIPVAWTSRDSSVRRLGTKWKRIQQLVYPAAAITFLHYAIQFNWKSAPEAIQVFTPLAVLVVYRLGRNAWKARVRSRANA